MRAWAALALAALVVAGGMIALLSSGGQSSPAAPVTTSTTQDAALTPSQTPAADGPSAEATTALAGVKRVSSDPLLERGRPLLFFMGAQFCPFCAAERWALVKATARFGTWRNLKELKTKRGIDGFGKLPSYDLIGATFTSTHLAIRHKEVADFDGNRLEPLEGVEQDLVNAYNPNGSFPFIAAGGPSGQFTVGLAYSPALIDGQSFDELRKAVESDANTPTVRAISGEADAITAALCELTAGKPAQACSLPGIKALRDQLG